MTRELRLSALIAAMAVIAGCADSVSPDNGLPGVGGGDGIEISGNLEGLIDGTQLVIENDGGESLTLVDNGPFSFDEGLAEGSSYQIAVVTQPQAQYCQLDDASGTISEASPPIQINCQTEDITLNLSPGATRVMANWEDVGASNYNLYWASEADFDPEEYASALNGGMASSVTPPFAIDELQPGKNYFAVLESVIGNETRYSSLGDARTLLPATEMEVNVTAQSEERLFLGGEFDHVGYQALGLHVMDASTGEPRARPWFRSETDSIGAISTLADDGMGGTLLGILGSLEDGHSSIGGLGGMVRLDDMGMIDADWGGDTSELASVIHIRVDHDHGIVYAMGSPAGGGGPISMSDLNLLVAYDLESGELLGEVVEFESEFSTMDVAGGRLFIGGEFEQLTMKNDDSTHSRQHVAAIDFDGHDWQLSDWSPDPDDMVSLITAYQHEDEIFSALVLVDDSILSLQSEPAIGKPAIGDGPSLVVVNQSAQVIATGLDDYDELQPWHMRTHDGAVYLAGGFMKDGDDYSMLRMASDGVIENAWLRDDIGSVGQVIVADNGTHYIFGDPEGGETPQIFAIDENDEPISGFHEAFSDHVHAMHLTGDRIMLAGSFRKHRIAPNGRLAVLGPDLEWETDWPRTESARVWDIAIADGRVLVAGAFRNMVDEDGEHDLRDIVAIDYDTRLVDTGWPTARPDGSGSGIVVVPASDGTVYFGGTFRDWDEDEDHATLVEILPNGNLGRDMPRFLNDDDNPSQVWALFLDEATDKLFVGGRYSRVDTGSGIEDRQLLVRLDVSGTSAAGLDSWAESLEFDGQATRLVRDIDQDLSLGPRLYFTGNFDELGTAGNMQVRDNAAALLTNASDTELHGWSPERQGFGSGGGWHLLIHPSADVSLVGDDLAFSGTSDPAILWVTDSESGNLVGHAGEQSSSMLSTRGLSRRPTDGRICVGFNGLRNTFAQFDGQIRRGLICFDEMYQPLW